MSDRIVRITDEQRNEFIEDLRAAFEAREGDSNDAEIEALWSVADWAMLAFDVEDV